MFLFSLLFFQMKNACFWSIVALLAIVLCLEAAAGITKVIESSFVLSRVLSCESYESPSNRRNKKAHNTSRSTIKSKNLASIKSKVFSWIFIWPVWHSFSLASLFLPVKFELALFFWHQSAFHTGTRNRCVVQEDTSFHTAHCDHKRKFFPLQFLRLNWDYRVNVWNPRPDYSSFSFDRRASAASAAV